MKPPLAESAARPPSARLSPVLLLAVVVLTLARAISGGEVIRRFDSDVSIREDGTIAVRETIRVHAEGDRIKYGIFRDLPLRSRASGSIDYEILSVSVDGVDAPDRRIVRSDDTVRVRMGNEREFLSRGEHTFILAYETSGGLKTLDGYCEFGWNVTGDNWAFAIESATCSITIPEDAVGITDTTGWLGAAGSTDSPVVISRQASNSALFAAERPILPGEHFTVAVRFPGRLASNPEHKRTMRAIVVILLAAGYFFIAWAVWGRDPKPGTVIPLFHSPQAGHYGGRARRGARRSAMSAAAMSYVRNAAFLDIKGFASVFISLAANGLCEIRRTDQDWFVVTPLGTTKPTFGPISEEEAAAYGEVLRASGVGKDFVLSSTNAGVIQRIHDKVVDILGKRYAALWAQNLWIQALGWLFVVPAGVLAINSPGEEVLARLLPVTMAAGFFLLVHRQVAYFWSHSINSYNPAGVVLTIMAIIAFVALRIRAVSLVVSGLWLLFYQVRTINVATIALVAIPMFFCPIMKAPSWAGRALLDKIDGLMMYMKTAERERLKALNPPEDTPEIYESILPFAVALGLEKTWTDRFAAMFDFDKPFGESRGFAHGGHNLGRLFQGGADAESFVKSLARTAVSPAMSGVIGGSFFGGGGGAGFGRGGGGGGGW